ncbi:MAG: decarboxylating 6-phosphogluconate dehydrogenase [Anaerolineae bacterium]|nr:MAG: decarboxylating 6-phosphogluconate dehydrogenase [Anaerolineae bacterium]
MDIALIGLGKMGANMARRLVRGGHRVVGFDRDFSLAESLQAEIGLTAVRTLPELAATLPAPRAAWVMVPAGDATEAVIAELAGLFALGDTIIDGGNTFYKDDIRRAAALKEKGIHYVDVGTSGGVWGLKEGYSLMVGGEAEDVSRLKPIFETLAPAPDKGWGHVGGVGAGHFVKMIHNGIEYGLMQAYAEGFEILHAKRDYALDLHQIAEIWRHGSVVRSWLLDLTANALAADQELSEIAGYVPDSGEGRWTVFEAVDLDIPAPVITLSLQQRFASRQEESFAAKLLAAMRNQFGGHAVKKVER